METVNPAKGGLHPSGPEEVVIFQAKLNVNKWMLWRFWTCSGACAQLCPILSPMYLLCGVSCRREEANSFKLSLTPHTINFTQMTYGCGCCCKSTVVKSIPLDKVQDVMLIGDCCGDVCGCSDGNNRPYQLQIQTAGASGAAAAELTAYCEWAR